MPFSLKERLLVLSIVVSVVAIGVSAAFAVASKEVRCRVGLQECTAPSSSPTATASRPPSSPAVKPPTFVDVGPDGAQPWLSFGEPDPAPAGPLTIALDEEQIVNRGKPVAITMRGSGFHGQSYADIEWNTPNGSTYKGMGTDVSADGTLEYALHWWPMQWAGIDGNNGRWPIIVKDRQSGAVVTLHIDVRSDADTPAPSAWPKRADWESLATGTPKLTVSGSGDLCTTGRRIELTVAGYPPEDNVTISYLRTDGGRIGSTNPSADGLGSIRNVVVTFHASDCTRGSCVPCGRDGDLRPCGRSGHPADRLTGPSDGSLGVGRLPGPSAGAGEAAGQ